MKILKTQYGTKILLEPIHVRSAAIKDNLEKKSRLKKEIWVTELQNCSVKSSLERTVRDPSKPRQINDLMADYT